VPLENAATLPSSGDLISVPVVLSSELSQLRPDVLSVKGLSLSAAMGGLTSLSTLTKASGLQTTFTAGSSLLKKPMLQGQGSA
jgi:hypothetical protein